MSSTDITPFNFENHEVRVVVIDGDPWWVVNDVCKVLEIVNTGNASSRIDEDDLRLAEVVDSAGRRQMSNIVNESGLYELIFRSGKPEAKRFRKWITSEVLPQIRKTGSYVLTPTTFLEALKSAVAAEEARIEAVEAKNVAEKMVAAAMVEVKELQPKAEEYDEYIDSRGNLTLAETAQLLHNTKGKPIGRQRLIGRLRELGVFCLPTAKENIRPLQKYLEYGWFECHPEIYYKGTNKQSYMQTYVTPKGVTGIFKILHDNGEDIVEPVFGSN